MIAAYWVSCPGISAHLSVPDLGVIYIIVPKKKNVDYTRICVSLVTPSNKSDLLVPQFPHISNEVYEACYKRGGLFHSCLPSSCQALGAARVAQMTLAIADAFKEVSTAFLVTLWTLITSIFAPKSTFALLVP